MEEHCGQYPVLHIDLTDLKASESWEGMYSEIWQRIKKVFIEHESDLPDFIPNLLQRDIDVHSERPPMDTLRILSDLIKALHEKHNRKVILLIDDYDVPMNIAAVNGFFDTAFEFFHPLYSRILGDNPCVKIACVVGTVEIGPTGVLCDIPTVRRFAITDEEFSKSFGFTTKDVKGLLGWKFKRSIDLYGGYQSGPHSMTQPFSTMNDYTSYSIEYCNESPEFLDSLQSLVQANSGALIREILMPFFETGKFSVGRVVNYKKKHWYADRMVHYLILKGYLTGFTEPPLNSMTPSRIRVGIPNRTMYNWWVSAIGNILEDYWVFGEGFKGRIRGSLQTPDFDAVKFHAILTSLIAQCSVHDLVFNKDEYHVAAMSAILFTFFGQSNVKVTTRREDWRGLYITTVQFLHERLAYVFQVKASHSMEEFEKDSLSSVRDSSSKYTDSIKDCKVVTMIGIAFYEKNVSPLQVHRVKVDASI